MNQNNEVPTKLHAKLITVATIGAVGGFLFGYDTSVINGAVDAIASPDSGFGLNAAMSGFSVSSAMIGCVVGAWFAGTLADRIGRVRVMQLAAALFVFSALFTGLASNIWVFVIFRIVGGLGVGFTSAIGPAYISEISPSSRRGFLTGFQQMAIALGIVASLVVNDSYLLGSGGAAVTFWAGLETWRWMLMTTAVPGVIMFALTFALPESPRYLVNKGDTRNAFKVLTLIRKDVDQTQVQIELDEIKAVAAQDTKGGVRELFRIARPALVAAIGIMLFQQLVGINSVIYFLPQVFIKGFGFPEGDAIWVSVGIGVVNFVSTIVATLIMDRFPRKGMLIFGSIVMTVSLAVLAVMNFVGDVAVLAVPTMILIAFYILGFAVSWGPIAWVLIGEIFPLSVRGIGSSFGSAANWLGNFIVSQFFLVLLDAFGNNVGGPFAIFGVFSALSIPFVMRLVPETNGKSLEEIEEEMTKR